MVIRILAMPDSLCLFDFNEVFLAVLGWDNTGFVFRVHGQECNSFRRASRPVTLSDFHLRPNETFLYTCGAVDLWEWDVRLLDEEQAEIHRILLEMTRRIGENAEPILASAAALGELELQFAKARFAEQYQCTRVKLLATNTTGGPFKPSFGLSGAVASELPGGPYLPSVGKCGEQEADASGSDFAVGLSA